MQAQLLPQWIIEKKRDGLTLTHDEIRCFIEAYAAGRIPDYQMAALAMAVYFRGMTAEETAALTQAMRFGGATLTWVGFPAPRIDKHSTGGVGDKVSLALAPLMAEAGLLVPMIAGRGLGATGGTIDKLESIPGYRTNLSPAQFKSVVRACGCSIVGQSKKIAPADRKLYALRDVTGTVPSIPLITASILSKKLSAGLDGLVLDVKWGSGAFMTDYGKACALARTLVDTAKALGLPCRALLTSMEQPLGRSAGNAVEVVEAMAVLKGQGPDDTRMLVIELGAHMLALARNGVNHEEARRKLAALLASGQALERFFKMVERHGGNARVLERPPEKWTGARVYRCVLPAQADGVVARADAALLGKACLALGAGRAAIGDTIDHLAGITDIKKCGERVNKGEPLAVLQAADKKKIASAMPLAAAAFEIGTVCPTLLPLIKEVIT